MPVSSSTIGGVNTWTFSGSVTDAELKTAWAALIVSGVYVLNRAIYLDNTADLTGCTGGFLVDLGTQVNPGFIFSTTRDKTKSTFRNFTFLQRVGLAVADRSNFVRTWNGSILSAPAGIDGLAQRGGGMIYGVPGNPGGGDPRFLNEMSFAGLEGVTIYSQEFTEQELQPVISQTTQLKGLTFEKCFGFPQIGTSLSSGNVNIVVYRSTQNTQNPTQFPIRVYPSGARYGAVCYVDSYVTRNNADITTRLGDFFGSNATNRAVVMVLNNYTLESWFGASKTSFNTMGNWNAANQIWGGILKKLQFVGGDGAVIRAYDSRSTTAAQKCSFLESGSVDFLDASLAPTTDAEGRISLVHIGALATGNGPSPAITRYNNQRFTFQKFGYRVSVNTVDMTQGGDNDLSAFTPIVPTEQEGIARTQASITAASSIESFQDLLEELHVLALGLVGSESYNGFANGNLFNYSGGILTTAFTTVNVEAAAASKISYNAATNTLTIKSTNLASTAAVQSWNNSTGAINLLNGAEITGIYTSSAGTSTVFEIRGVKNGAAYIAATNSTKATIQYGINSTGTTQDYSLYFPPGSTGTQVYVARQAYGDQFDFEVVTLAPGGMWYQFTDIPDEGISQTNLATVQAYTTLETNNKLYDYICAHRMTEAGIKLGNIVTRAGPLLQFANYSGKLHKTAPSVFSISGNLITVRTTVLSSTSRYTTIIATPPAAWTSDTDEIYDVDREDANGDSSVNIQAASISTFEIWKVADGVPEDQYDTGTLLGTTGPGKYRFLNANGFKAVIRDQLTNYRVSVEMEKGVYTAELFFGRQVQLAQSATVEQIYALMQIMGIDVDTIIANQQIINLGVRKSSLLIPHTNNTAV